MSTASHAATLQKLASLSASYVSELAPLASGIGDFHVVSWQYEPLYGGSGSAVGGTALFRLTISGSRRQACSLILKVLYARRDEATDSPYYWKREYEVYRSNLLSHLPAGTFSTPRIYRLHDFGESCWIWMEDIKDTKGDWTTDDFREIARRLGRFNGHWLMRRALPACGWLTTNWHSAILPALAATFENLDQMLNCSLARAALPFEDKDEIEAIWHGRQLFQNALITLPRTLCHTDAFRRNILHRRNDVVLLDWALASIGAIGDELVCLVAVSLYYEGYSVEDADRLDKIVFAGYVEGLRQAGWSGDSTLARIGFTCGMVLRGLAGVKQDLQLLRDQARHEQLLRTHRLTSLSAITSLYAAVRRFRLLKMAREARRLLSA